MMNCYQEGLRLTHLPTGTVITCRGYRRSFPHGSYLMARRMLASILRRPNEPPNPARSYVLDPRWSGRKAPFVEQGGKILVEGAARVIKALNGDPEGVLIRPRPRTGTVDSAGPCQVR